MFTLARLKLTAWYLLISVLVSLLFSLAIFSILSFQLDRDYARLSRRFEERERLIPNLNKPPLLEPGVLNNAKKQIKESLILINLAILAVCALAGFFLAGRTLKPLKEMLDEQNRFIADASHELRTPLTALRTSLEVNLRDKNLNLKKVRSVLKDSLEEVEGLQDLAENLLLLAKTENLDTDNQFNPVSLSMVVKKAVEKMSVLARQKNMKIEQDLSDVVFEADEEKITRLFLILLDNAIKYSDKDKTVKIVARTLDHKIEIKVEDQGLGIPEKDLPLIFHRFYRVDFSRSKTSGFGLGLSIAQEIVKLHHGSIKATSKLGQGSYFTVSLPI